MTLGDSAISETARVQPRLPHSGFDGCKHCRDYLYITTDSTHRELREGRLKQVRKMYGFPILVLPDKALTIAHAKSWMNC